MRNLKKILSLALALVMVFSLVTFASAKDFGDADQVEHTEAANVLNALGIVEGYEDGNFYPDRVVKRGEMAKMIAFIVNGGKDPVLNPAEVSYNDTANHWAKGYIEYCTGLGIVSGYGDGSFKPDNTVTGTEAAKMLLIAMGYNSDIREYTGPSWSLNVGVDANQKDLYKNLTYVNPSNGLDRDATAQMVYNCLNAKGVYRSDSIGVQDGKVTYNYTDDIYTVLYRKMNVARIEGVVVGNEYADLTANGTNGHEQAGKTAVVVTNYDELVNVGGVGANTIMSISNSASFSAPSTAPSVAPINDRTDTFAVSTGKDELGKAVILFARPASNSRSPEKATVIGSVVLDENTVMTRTESWSKQSKIDDALRAAGLKTTTPGIFYINGEASSAGAYNYTNAGTANVNRSGYKTQFIDFDLDGTVDFVLVDKVDFGKVTIKSTKSAGSMTIATGDGTPNVKKDDSKDIIGFDDVAQGDYVLYSEVGGRLYVEKPETVTGKLTDYSKQGDTSTTDGGDSALWVDGTKIKNSGATGWDCDGSKLSNPKKYGSGGLDKEATYYLDACGYIVAVDGTGVQKFALATYYNADAYNEGGITTSARAQVTFEDGTSSAPKVSSATQSVLAPLSGTNLATNAVLGQYTYNSDDELILTVPAKNGTANAGTFKYVSGNILVSSNGSNLQVSGKNLYMTSNTVVFFVETVDNGLIGSKKVDKVTTYVGKDSTPGIELDSDYIVKYIYNEDNEIQAMAVISGSISAVADNYLYLIKIDRTGTKTKTGLAVIDGEVREVVIDSGSETTVTAGKAYEYSTTATGSLKLKDISASKLAGKYPVEQVNTNDNTVVVNGIEYKVTNKTTIANLDDEETLSLSGLNKGDIVTVLFDTSGSDKTALGIYIHETVDPSSASLADIDTVAVTEANGIVGAAKKSSATAGCAADWDVTFKGTVTVTDLVNSLVVAKDATKAAFDEVGCTTSATGNLADNKVVFVKVTPSDGDTTKAKIYKITAKEYAEPAKTYPAGTAAATIKTEVEAASAGKSFIVSENLAIPSGGMSVPTGVTLTVNGNVTGTDALTVVGTAVVKGDVAKATVNGGTLTAKVDAANKAIADLTIGANGGIVNGDVTTLTAASGDATITGNIADITAIGADGKTITVDGNVTGTITSVVDGTVTFKGTVGAVTVTDGTVEFQKPVTTVTDVVTGTVTFKDTVGTVTVITAGTVEFQKGVTTVTDITAGTITFKDAVAAVKDISGGTVTFEKTATVDAAATLAGTIKLTTANSALTLGATTEAISIAGVTFSDAAENSQIIFASNAVTVGADQVYQTGGTTAETAGVVATQKTYKADNTGKFIATT